MPAWNFWLEDLFFYCFLFDSANTFKIGNLQICGKKKKKNRGFVNLTTATSFEEKEI